MYVEHFGLRELPFTLTPNTRFYMNLASHQDAYNLMLVALHCGDGFIKVVGEVGSGKTLLCRKLLNSLDSAEFISAYIHNPYLNPNEFRCAVASELGIDSRGKTDHDLLQALTQRLIGYAHQGKRVVLVVDEAQAMPDETIEALRLLSNLETESGKLFQVVLFGQPELDNKLDKYSLRQLKQRITYSYLLRTLDLDEVSAYINGRMQAAGHEGKPVFNRRTCDFIARASGGVPRLVNILSHKALLAAYGKGDREVAVSSAQRAVHDTEGVHAPRMDVGQWLKAVAATLAVAVLTFFAIAGIQQ